MFFDILFSFHVANFSLINTIIQYSDDQFLTWLWPENFFLNVKSIYASNVGLSQIHQLMH